MFRIATFNIENLMNRFDFSGFRNHLQQDRALALFALKDEAEYRRLEQARAISLSDDTRQLSALAIAETRADIVCLQEVDNIEALKAFEYGYLFRMVGEGYKQKFTTAGNDTRGIDVALMMRDTTRDGEAIEFVAMTSHAHLTFAEAGLHTPELAALGHEPFERIFRRDCLEIDVRIGGRPLTIFVVHFKSMGGPRDGIPGRQATMPMRLAEARAVRGIIEARFAPDAGDRDWLVCGDFNDYSERIVVAGDAHDGYRFDVIEEAQSSLDALLEGGFSENLVARRPAIDRWTLFHNRGPLERHLCQLDYILASPRLSQANADAVPEIIRGGQPWRTPLPPGQAVERYPRVGWDRPKASDHCPVAVSLSLS